jgi:hypothetical protein
MAILLSRRRQGSGPRVSSSDGNHLYLIMHTLFIDLQELSKSDIGLPYTLPSTTSLLALSN